MYYLKSPTDQHTNYIHPPVLHLQFDPYSQQCYDLSQFPEAEQGFSGHKRCEEFNRTNPDKPICCDVQYLRLQSPPLSEVPGEITAMFKEELRDMFFQFIASDLRSTEAYNSKWRAYWDLPYAKLNQDGVVIVEQEDMVTFFNKEVMLYIDDALVHPGCHDFDFAILGRYLFRTWLRQYDGRPPLQRGACIVMPMLQNNMNLNQLSRYHAGLTEMVSQSLDDLVSFDLDDQSMDEPSLPAKCFFGHGYLMRPLFRALYMVYDDQLDVDRDESTKPVPNGHYEGYQVYGNKLRGWIQSNDTVLLVRTGQEAHISSAISLLPLFESGLALHVNRPDYEGISDTMVVRVTLSTALQCIQEENTAKTWTNICGNRIQVVMILLPR